MNRTPPRGAEYWDNVEADFVEHDAVVTWRAYMQASYRSLMARWFAEGPPGRTLKTDLFEEAITDRHLFWDLGAQGVGLDVSLAVVRSAARRCARSAGMSGGATPPAMLVADLRALPLASGTFLRIVSGSSLDHFERRGDIAVALAELERVLAPGGCLVVTFDNPHNPLVWLRNQLPFRWLSAIGLVPYFVGATYDRADVARECARVGLRITHMSAIVHVPRVPAIWLAALTERWLGCRESKALLRVYRAFDGLERSPLCYRTGHYLAVRAEKRAVSRTDDVSSVSGVAERLAGADNGALVHESNVRLRGEQPTPRSPTARRP